MALSFTTSSFAQVSTNDGRNFTVLSSIELNTDQGLEYRVPPGSQTDGASTPREMWCSIPPFGDYWLAAVIHDSAYRGTLEYKKANGDWVPAMLSKEDCDTLLLEAMKALGVDEIIRATIYEGVKVGGWKAFRDDRSTTAAAAPSPALTAPATG